MDIFAKCYEPSLAGELKEKGVYPYFHALQSRQDVEVMMEASAASCWAPTTIWG